MEGVQQRVGRKSAQNLSLELHKTLGVKQKSIICLWKKVQNQSRDLRKEENYRVM